MKGLSKKGGPVGLVAKSHRIDLRIRLKFGSDERSEASSAPWLKQSDYQWGIEGDYTC